MTYSPEKPTKYPNGISLGNDVVMYAGSGAPSSTTLDAVAGPGSMYFDYTNKVTYINDGTKATPSWEIANGSGAGSKAVYNGTGGTLTEGTLVYLSGVDATTTLPKIVKADANVAGAPAEYILRDDIADVTAGIVYKSHRLTAQNDNTGTVGDERYLSETVGGYTATAPTDEGSIVQVVGVLEVKSATVGVVNFNLDRIEKVGKNQLLDDSVQAAALGVTAGAITASRALVADANSNVAAIKTTSLAIGVSGSEVAMTASMAEINELADMTSRVQSTVAVAAEAADAIAITVTLKNAANAAVTGMRTVRVWFSSSNTTGAIAADDGITTTATTGLILTEHVDDLLIDCVTSTTGVLVVNMAGAGDLTAKYLWVDTPGFSKPVVSAVADLIA